MDVNECLLGFCDENALCTNSDGKFFSLRDRFQFPNTVLVHFCCHNLCWQIHPICVDTFLGVWNNKNELFVFLFDKVTTYKYYKTSNVLYDIWHMINLTYDYLCWHFSAGIILSIGLLLGKMRVSVNFILGTISIPGRYLTWDKSKHSFFLIFKNARWI